MPSEHDQGLLDVKPKLHCVCNPQTINEALSDTGHGRHAQDTRDNEKYTDIQDEYESTNEVERHR